MLRRTVIAALAVALFAPMARAEDGDEEKEKALEYFAKAVKNMNESEGYHLDTKIDVDMGGSSMPGGTVEGLVRNPEFQYFKVDIAGNALDIFKEGDRIAYLNPQTGKWEGQTGNQTLDFFVKIFNLGSLLGQLRESADDAEFGKSDSVGKRSCRVVEFGVPKKALEKLMEGTGKGTNLGVSPENAKMRVKTWIDKKEGLPRRIQITIDVEMKGLPGAPGKDEEWEDWEEDEEEGEEGKKKPKEKDEDEEEIPPMQIAITVTAGIKNYGTDLEVKVPKDAQKVLDSQKKEESGPRKKDKEEDDK